MKPRLMLVAFGLMALSLVALGIQAQEGAKIAQEKDDLITSEQQLLRQFSDFKNALLTLKNRLARGTPQEKRRAEDLEKVLEECNNLAINQEFTKMIELMRGAKLNKSSDIEKLKDQSENIAIRLRRILDMLQDSRPDRRAQDIKDLKDIINKLGIAIEAQANAKELNQRGRTEQKELQALQKAATERAEKVGDAIQKFLDRDKKGGGGEAGKPSKGDNKDGGKGEAGKGEVKDSGKGGEADKGSAKDEGGKGGEGEKGAAKPSDGGKPSSGDKPDAKSGAKPSDGKGGEGAKAGAKGDPMSAKGGEGASKDKGGDSKGGEGGAKDAGKDGGKESGQPGAAKPDDKKTGETGAKKGPEGNPDSKPGSKEAKGGEKAGGDSKPGGDPKAGDSKPGDSKSGDAKSGDAKAGGAPPMGGSPPMGGEPSAKGGDSPPSGGSPPPGGNKQDDDIKASQKRIQEAGYDQSKAEDKLKKDPKEAVPPQGDAKDKLEKAKKQLEDLLRQMREEEIERVLAALQARCEKMLMMQIQVLAGTEDTDKAIARNADKKPTRDNKLSALKLSDTEKEIIQEVNKCIDILQSEGSAVAFPEVFQQVRQDMIHVQKRLEVTDVGDLTQNIEKDIIESLKEMVEALKKAREDNQDPSPPGKPGPSKAGKPGDQKLLELLQELKMVRALQKRVNDRTTDYGKRFPGEQAADAQVVRELRQLAERQQRIQRIVEDIAKGANK